MDEFTAALRQSTRELSAAISESKQLRGQIQALKERREAQKLSRTSQAIPENVKPFDWFRGYRDREHS